MKKRILTSLLNQWVAAQKLLFCIALTNQKCGDNSLLSAISPNLMSPTFMFNKVDIKNVKQSVQIFRPTLCSVVVADSVREGVIPIEEENDLFKGLGVFIHWDAEDNENIQD